MAPRSFLPSPESIRRLGDELQSSRAHINNAAVLVSLLLKAADAEADREPSSSSSTRSLLQALHSLRIFFVSLLSDKRELSLEIHDEAKKRLQEGASGGEKDQAQAIYQSWLWEKYNEFLDSLSRIMVSPSMDSALQEASVDALMEFVREEKQGDFSNRVYEKICSSLVVCKDFNKKVIEHFVTNYFNFVDVCCYTCINLKNTLILHCGTKSKGNGLTTNNYAPLEISIESLMLNICDVLACLKAPTIGTKDSKTVIEYWGTTGDNKRQGIKKSDNDGNSATIKDVKKMKSKITRAWLTFLGYPLTRSVYEKVLGLMHKAIIPNLTNPVLVSDFLTSSYNKGGLISVMALSGLFSLITQYGLEYPDFYTKLYALLEPSIFVAKYRARFFELLDTSLKSPLLPSYLAAAFAKKLGRIALYSPPAGALIAIAIIHNLLRRHPSINCLVHKDYVDTNCPVLEDGKSGQVQCLTEDNEALAEIQGVDPFIICEDPVKANALKSSLWEIDALRRHYCPVVSRFVASLETDLTVRAKTTELAIKDFSSGSYSTIFTEEVKRRMKQVPLAFYKTCPTALFSKSSDVSPMLGQTDFPGWSFQSKENQVIEMQSEAKTPPKEQHELQSIVEGDDNDDNDDDGDDGCKVLTKIKKNKKKRRKKSSS